MKITKQTFVEAINNIEKQYRAESAFSDAVNTYFCDDVDNSLPRNWVVNSLVKILKQHFDDEHTESWIEYFCWELNFGKKDAKVKVKGKPFALKTAEDLYKLLTL